MKLYYCIPLFLAVAGCADVRARADASPQADVDPQAEAEIKQMLNQAATDWTAGNLDGFMASYHNSPELRFAHPKGITLGYDTVKERYAKSIAKSDLKFSDLDMTLLSPDAALAFGRFHNRGKDGIYATGLFTLLVRKIDGHWKVTHDHSSDLPADARIERFTHSRDT